MRPLRDATPVLLVAVVLLFTLLALVRLYDRLLPRPPPPDPAAALRPFGKELLAQASRSLEARVLDPRDPLFMAFRSPVSPRSVAFSLPVTATIPETTSPGTVIRGGRVQGELLERRALIPGDLPHTGRLRLEVTFSRGRETVWRSYRERGYRLVRLAPPPPFGADGFLLLEAGGMLERAEEGRPSAARVDLETSASDLEQLLVARNALQEQVRNVATQFVEYVHGFRHLGGEGVEPPELLAARWISRVPVPPSPGRAPEELLAPRTALRTRWRTVDLTRWGGFRRWAEVLANERSRAGADYSEAWEEWRAAVARVFRRRDWEAVGTADELFRWTRRCREELTTALDRLGAAGARWADYDVRTRRHYRRVAEYFDVLGEESAGVYRAGLARLAAGIWRPQAAIVFEGEDAATRCGQFLEGAAGPFAKETEAVIFLDNAGGPALELGEKTFPGRLVIVATGDLSVANLGPRDSRLHRLVLQAGGRLTVRGRVRAHLLALGGVTMSSDAHVVGGLLLAGMGRGDALSGRVEWDPVAGRRDRLEDLRVDLVPGED